MFPSEPELWQQQSGEMAGSLALRKVDAAAFFPPFSDYALRVGLAKVLFVDPLFALHHRDDLARLLRTWKAAHEYADRHPDEADKLIAFREKLAAFRPPEGLLDAPTSTSFDDGEWAL